MEVEVDAQQQHLSSFKIPHKHINFNNKLSNISSYTVANIIIINSLNHFAYFSGQLIDRTSVD